MKPALAGMWVLVLLMGALASEARAEVKAELEFSSEGESCPGVSAMRAAVNRRLGYDPFVERAILRVTVEIQVRGGELVGKARFVRASSAVGERQMTASLGACSGLVDSLALAISLALDPDAVERPRLPRRAREGGEGRVGLNRLPSALLAVEEAKPESTDRGDVQGALETGAWMRLGSAPKTAPGVSAGGTLRTSRLMAGLSIRARLPASGVASSVLLTTYAIAIATRVCLAGETARACLVGELGAEHARGDGLSETGGAWSAAASAGAQIGWDLIRRDRWRWEVAAELMSPVVGQSYRAEEVELWRSPLVAVGFGVRAHWSPP